jgi:hypothetical protein
MILFMIPSITVICMNILTIRKFLYLHKIKNGKLCRPALRLGIIIGSSLGILVWSCIIGFIVNLLTSNTNYFINVVFVGSLISIIPCISGVFHLLRIHSKCHPDKCFVNKYRSGYCD